MSMENIYPLHTQIQESVIMAAPALKNKLDDLLAEKGWDSKMFVGYCIIEGLSHDTANRLVKGETQFTTETIAVFAKVLGVNSIADVIDLDNDEGDPA